MKSKRKSKNLWVAVKVERGFVSKARIFESFDKAKKTESRWRARLNSDYDEAAALKAS